MTSPRPTRLYTVELSSVSKVGGPLLFLEGVDGASIGEVVEVVGPDGQPRRGEVLEVHERRAVIQVLEGTRGLDLARTRVRLRGEPVRVGVGRDLLGRTLDGAGRPLDGDPPPLVEALRDVQGAPINPLARAHPSEFVETGISAIDGLNTLVRGQKLPIFSGFGLPADALAARIAAHARVPAEGASGFAVVFAAMGITRLQASFFRRSLEQSGALPRTILFQNLAEDPSIERLLLPRAALTCAEHLAFEHGMHVLAILTDMTSYCEALREVATARLEVPGRRGYPGYLYTDLASIYERAGRIRGRPGSLTQLVILSMPDDDITHPVPDLTGYVTEGQVVLSRELHRRGIDPPIDVLSSLSRLMNAGIGAGRTREDHRPLADQLYALYARGCDLRRLQAVVGEGALTSEDQRHLDFAGRFERELVHQGDRARGLAETLEGAWALLEGFSADELKRIPPALLARRRAP